jgi:hypothetical protein
LGESQGRAQQKSRKSSSKNLFYVFVNLRNEKERPYFHIVPSRVVANRVKRGYAKWIKTLARSGKKHKDTSMRKFWDDREKYRDKWEILGLD